MKLGSLFLATALHGLGTSPLLVTARQLSSAENASSGLFNTDTTPTRNGQPKEILSIDGRLEVTLDVSLVRTDELDRTAPGYNGGPVGPTLRAKPGDTVHITLINNLEPSPSEHVEMSSFAMTPIDDDEAKMINQTLLVNRLHYPTGNMQVLPPEGYWGKSFQNLHFHGLMVDPSIDDSRIYIDGGGTSMTYEFEIPKDSPPLFGFYHNHVHGTAAYSFLSGLFGLFIIEDPVSDPLPSYIASVPQVSEHLLLLSESRNNPDDDTPVDFIPIVMDFDWDHVTNGQLNPTYQFKKGEVVHFRAVNAGVEPSMELSIENHTITLYANDGYPIPKPEETEVVRIGTGSRAEFIVKFDSPGSYKFKRAPHNFRIEGEMCNVVFGIPLDTCVSFDKETVVALIEVLDEEVNADETVELWDPASSIATPVMTRSGTPEMDPYLKSMLELPKGESRVVTFDQSDEYPIFQIPYDGPHEGPMVGFGVNKMLFNPHYFHGDIVGGTCEDWTFKYINSPFHTIHTHSVPFYVTSMDGVELDEEDRFWRDTFARRLNFTATICFPPRATESYINVHCHMPQHQDAGMAANYKLLPGGQNVDMATTDEPLPGDEKVDTNTPDEPLPDDQNVDTATPDELPPVDQNVDMATPDEDSDSGCKTFGMSTMVLALACISLLFV